MARLIGVGMKKVEFYCNDKDCILPLHDKLTVIIGATEDYIRFSVLKAVCKATEDIGKGIEGTAASLIEDFEHPKATAMKSLLFLIQREVSNWGSEKPAIFISDGVMTKISLQEEYDVIGILQSTFPTVQFVIFTKSPIIVSTIQPENLLYFRYGKITQNMQPTFGRDINSILTDIFRVQCRPKWAVEKIEHCFYLLDNKHYQEAEIEIELLIKDLGSDDPDIVYMQSILSF